MTGDAASAAQGLARKARDLVMQNGQGFAVATMVAVVAQFLSEHYGAPAMLMALLLGLAFHFLAEEGPCVAGVAFTSKTVLRIGVALLGVRISVDQLIALGWAQIAMIVGGVILTILFGLIAARLFHQNWRMGLLTGGAVAICGASAAMAIAAVLPKDEHSERNLIFTVLGVTILSTVAMVLYPVITQWFGLDYHDSGVFLGGTIHDVAQVVGAGFSVSEETGETATLVKLMRVTMLAPVVVIFALSIRLFAKAPEGEGKRPPLLPFFVVMFLVFAALNSFGLIPTLVQGFVSDVSRWALLISIAAVGMKTSLRIVTEVGGQSIALIVAETLFIGGFILWGIHLLTS